MKNVLNIFCVKKNNKYIFFYFILNIKKKFIVFYIVDFYIKWYFFVELKRYLLIFVSFNFIYINFLLKCLFYFLRYFLFVFKNLF